MTTTVWRTGWKLSLFTLALWFGAWADPAQAQMYWGYGANSLQGNRAVYYNRPYASRYQRYDRYRSGYLVRTGRGYTVYYPSFYGR